MNRRASIGALSLALLFVCGGLDGGAWYPAASVAAWYSSWLVRHPGRASVGAPLRGLDTAHFEFRGGVPREEPWTPGRSPDDRRPEP